MKFFKDDEVCRKCAMWSLTLLRVVMGIILINHGYVKLFGESTQLLAFFESTVLPAPGAMLILAGIIEFFGGILLILGLMTRLVAVIVALEFIVILLFVKLKSGLSQVELELLIFTTVIVLSNLGAGKWSVDGWLQGRKKKEIKEQ